MSETTEVEQVEHFGSCHCGTVKWKCLGPRVLNCCSCNCSVCKKKSNDHFIAHKSKFTLLEGEENLTLYTFNTGVAKHRFCKICGVQSFYQPRSNPDSVAIMPHCIDSDTVEKLEFRYFDGQNWEKSMEKRAPVAFK